MSEDATRTLYATSKQDRYFWIPDDHTCEAGELLIRSLSGFKKEISDAEAAKWEIPEEQAKELAQIQIRHYAQAAGSMLSSAGQLLRQAAQNAKQAPVKPTVTEGQQTVADAIGVTPEQLKNDPEAVFGGLKEVMQGLGETLKQAASDNPADKETIKARMELLAGAIREQTGDETIGDNVEELPKIISDFLANPELVGRIRKATEDIKRASAEIRATSAVKKPD